MEVRQTDIFNTKEEAPEELDGYILIESENGKQRMIDAMSTLGAIQFFTSMKSATEMAKMCSSKNSSWKPLPVKMCARSNDVKPRVGEV